MSVLFKINLVISLLSIIFFTSCKQSILDFNPEDTDPISKTWVYSHYDEELDAQVYFAAKALQWDAPGYIFHDNGTLKVRQNSGWCGTPPISYENYDGNWEYVDDSEISLSTDYWGSSEGGKELKYHLLILELTEEQLVVQYQQ